MSQFYCREDELRKLNKRYAGDKFECIVIYGRRRVGNCLLYTSPSPRDRTRSRMPSSA